MVRTTFREGVLRREAFAQLVTHGETAISLLNLPGDLCR
jgi:hypothetical protein